VCGAPSVRASRYGVVAGSLCGWEAESRRSGTGCFAAFAAAPRTLSRARCFSAASFGQSRDQASCSPPQVHLGLVVALHAVVLCSEEEHRPHLSLLLQELAICP
jgi:hypothetical protein